MLSIKTSSILSGHVCKMAFMQSFGERLVLAITHAKSSRAKLATHLGISVQAVGDAIRGKTASFTAENSAKAARFLKVDGDWLAAGIGSMTRASTSMTAQEPGARYDALTDSERRLLDDFRYLPDEDQQQIAGDIAQRAGKARAHIQKVLRSMGLADKAMPDLGAVTAKDLEAFQKAHVAVTAPHTKRKTS